MQNTATHDASENAGAVPTITLAGKQWPVPQLAPRQNRIVVPALLDVIPRVIRAREEGGGDFAQLARYLDTPTYDRLGDIAFHALTRVHPDLKRAEFDDMPIDTIELIVAVNVIARQAGLIKPVDAGV